MSLRHMHAVVSSLACRHNFPGDSSRRSEHGFTVCIVAQQVAEVLRGSDALVVSEDGKLVRRKEPLDAPEEIAMQVDARSLFAGAPLAIPFSGLPLSTTPCGRALPACRPLHKLHEQNPSV